MADDLRISTNKDKFNKYLNATDDLQKSALPAPSTDKRYTIWGWKDEESTQWTEFRKTSNEYMTLLGDPDTYSPAVVKKMNKHIKEVRLYDNDKINGHHLLDKVAVFGTMDDQITFNLKRDTSMAEEPSEGEKKPMMIVPALSIIQFGLGQQLIGATQSDGKKTKALPEGMKFLKIYRAIASVRPESFDDYHFLGNAKRGRLLSSFEGIQIPEDKKLNAYYIARYESTTGALGGLSAVLESPIMVAV